MKLFIITLVAVMSFSSYGNYKWELERNLKTLSQQVYALSTRNADLLSTRELKDSIRKLKVLKSTLLGLNHQYPRPVCSQESPQRMKLTFKSIKHFAYSIKGPELSQEEAIQYAIDWTNTYPCDYSRNFERDYLMVKRYASVSNGGLNLPSDEAIVYANEKTDMFCGDDNFKQDFWAAFKLARYEMEMSDAQARSYAKRIVERDHFTCRWDDRIIENNVDLTPTINMGQTCITPIIIPLTPRNHRRPVVIRN
jgi:hypothetical protein